MSEAAVLVASMQLGETVRAEIFAACRRAGAQPVAFPTASEAADVALNGGATPLLLIGELPSGERRIPARLVDAATRLDLPILLVCREPLVRPLVSTHGGRVTLLGQPASSARIQGTVRMLLAGRVSEPSAGDFSVDEHLGPFSWTASFGVHGHYAPAVRQQADGSATVLLPLGGGGDAALPAACVEAANLVGAGLSDDETLAVLGERLGTATAMLHLDALHASFTLYWPTGRLPYIYSRFRLPNLCALSALSPERRLCRVATSHGDLLIAILHEPAWTQVGALTNGLADGGPALLARLEEHAASSASAIPTGSPMVGFLAEVR
jgi:hypothetical protein